MLSDLSDIIMLAVATEIGTKNTWAENISFGSSEADFMLKKMSMLCCYEMAKDITMFEVNISLFHCSLGD